MNILSVEKKHVKILEDLHRQTFQDFWDEESFLNLLMTCVGWLAQEDDTFVGFVLGQSFSPEIHTLCVLPSYQRRGIGSALLTTFTQHIQPPLTLEVAVGNTRAQAFYGAHGFHIISLRPKYYGDEDAFVMQLKEAPTP